MENTVTLGPSPQQLAVYDFVEHGSGSAQIEAVAGSGKTTTLLGAVALMQGSVAFAAYNKKIADEIQTKLGRMNLGPQVRAGTFHSFGFRSWRQVAPKVQVESRKLFKLQDELKQSDTPLAEFARKAVSLAKQAGIGLFSQLEDRQAWYQLVAHFDLEETLISDGKRPKAVDLDELVEKGIDAAITLLKLSIERDTVMIDFDDMIYAPLIHNAKVWQNDWVLVDEAQDTNPVRRAFAKKMLKPGGRFLAVGDSRQAIYGFTGADANAMKLIEQEFACTTMPLTVTYRCPKSVVQFARQWVSHIEPHPDAPQGVYRTMDEEEFLAGPFDPSDAILCRNTKPLVELAYGFIKRGIPCHVEGRDIGAGLLALAKKWKRIHAVDDLVDRLVLWREAETERLLAKGQEVKAESLADKVDTLLIIIQQLPGGATMYDLELKITTLFEDSEGNARQTLTLSTVHKSKGREWDRVFLYGRNWYMPSKYARQDWQKLQEANLCYVAATRAKKTLVDVLRGAPQP